MFGDHDLKHDPKIVGFKELGFGELRFEMRGCLPVLGDCTEAHVL
jgi:hypothetical protein